MKFNGKDRRRIGMDGYISCEARERREWEERESCKSKRKEERETLGVLVEESHWLGPGRLQDIIRQQY